MTIIRLKHTAAFYVRLVQKMRDQYENGHARHTAEMSRKLAAATGLYSEDELEIIYNAMLLHDVGKFGIMDVINKPGRFTEAEEYLVHGHPQFGYELMLAENFSQPVNKILLPIVLHHHENWDGSGYPDGLAGENIPHPARIARIVDYYDAVDTDNRSYEPYGILSMSSLDTLMGNYTWFDPALLKTFVKLIKDGFK